MNHDLHFVEEAFRKQRTDGAVDQARCQRFELAGTAFALEEAARNAAGGVGFFKVVDGQGEEVLARLGFSLGHYGSQHHGAVHIQQHGAAGLACNFAGFHGDLVLAPLEGFGDFIENTHVFLSMVSGTREAPD
jgi:hypothetical protein